jgi:hypothetical protein
MADTRVKFQPIWDVYPDIRADGVHDPCVDKKGNKVYGNQCAIRLGEAFKLAGIIVPRTDSTAQCKLAGHPQHVLLAEQLGMWLLYQKVRFGAVEKKVGQKWDPTNGVSAASYAKRKGVIFFKDFWARDGENEAKNPTGDHIDLWDGTRQGSSSGNDSYFTRSKQVWFWELP